MLLIGALNCWL